MLLGTLHLLVLNLMDIYTSLVFSVKVFHNLNDVLSISVKVIFVGITN